MPHKENINKYKVQVIIANCFVFIVNFRCTFQLNERFKCLKSLFVIYGAN